SELPATAFVPSANGQIIHRALRGGRDQVGNGLGQSSQQHIDNALRRFDISAGYRRRRQGVDDRARRRDDADGFDDARARRDVARDQTAEDVVDGRNRYRLDRVDRPADLRRTAREINFRLLPDNLYSDGDWRRVIRFAVVVQKIFRLIDSIGNRGERAPHQPRRVINQVRGVLIGLLETVTLDNLQQSPAADS